MALWPHAAGRLAVYAAGLSWRPCTSATAPAMRGGSLHLAMLVGPGSPTQRAFIAAAAKAYMSDTSAMTFSVGLPAPCPARTSMRVTCISSRFQVHTYRLRSHLHQNYQVCRQVHAAKRMQQLQEHASGTRKRHASESDDELQRMRAYQRAGLRAVWRAGERVV